MDSSERCYYVIKGARGRTDGVADMCAAGSKQGRCGMDTVLNADIRKITEARHHDPISVLGKHDEQDRVAVRAFITEATEVMVVEGRHSMQPIDGSGLFEWRGSRVSILDRYRFILRVSEHRDHNTHNPKCFPPQLSDFD